MGEIGAAAGFSATARACGESTGGFFAGLRLLPAGSAALAADAFA
jgi:hypothetical protein